MIWLFLYSIGTAFIIGVFIVYNDEVAEREGEKRLYGSELGLFVIILTLLWPIVLVYYVINKIIGMLK